MHNYTLRQTIPALLLLLLPCMLYGQKYALAIDSLTKAHISRLPKSKQIKFDSLLAQRLAFNLLHRIDSLPFDYAFIQEEFCYSGSIGEVIERYFIASDTIPRYEFQNGQSSDPQKIYFGTFLWYSSYIRNHYSLYPLIKVYSKFKATQVLQFEKEQIWDHGCIIFENSKAEFIKDKTTALKSTYRIMTMVDNRKSKITVSVQYAPKKPTFKPIGYNSIEDQ